MPDNLRAELMRYPPFAQMQAAHVDYFIAAAEQARWRNTQATCIDPSYGG